MTVDFLLDKLKRLARHVPDGEAWEGVAEDLRALIFTESERAAGIARDCGSKWAAKEILRTSPGRLDVKYDRAYASPGKRGG